MRIVTCLVVALLAAACGGSPKHASARPIAGEAGRRLTGQECEMVVDHAIDLLEADATTQDLVPALRAERQTAVEQCVTRATKRDFECYMAAHELVALKTCDDQQGEVRASN